MGEISDAWDRVAAATELEVAPEGEPVSSEEKMVGAASYLMGFVGAWLWGPLIIYFWQRKRSSFIAYHAIQAVILQLIVTIFTSMAMVAMMIGWIGGNIAYQAKNTSFAIAVWVATALFFVFTTLYPLFMMCRGAWVGAHGRLYEAPLVGRVAHLLVPAARRPSAAL